MKRTITVGAMAVLALLLVAPPALAAKFVVGTDQALQAALDNATNGDKIIIKKGNYTGPFTLTGTVNLKIIGKGKPVISTIGEGEHGLDISVVNGVKIQGIVIDGTGPDGHGILATNCINLTITKCTVRNTGDDGVRLEGCRDSTVSKCTVEDTGGDGVALQANEFDVISADSVVTKNTIQRTGGDGVRLVGVRCTISKCTINDTDGDGIRDRDDVEGTADNTFTKNKITDTEEGIKSESVRAVVTKNKLMDNDQDAYDLAGFGTECSKNKADGAGVGILARGDEMVVEKNTVQNLRSDGMRIEGVNGTYTKNTFKTVAQDGVQVEETATANTLTRNTVDGAGGVSYLLIGSLNTLNLNRAFTVGAMALQDISANGNSLNGNNF